MAQEIIGFAPIVNEGTIEYVRGLISKDSAFHTNISVWPDINIIEEGDNEIIDISVVDTTRTDALTSMAKLVSADVQFPINTVFMHGMGIIASVMTKSFSYKYYGTESPVNLYVVTSQPPSTGKSGVNKYFTAPARHCFKEHNENQKIKRDAIEAKISSCKSKLKEQGEKRQKALLMAEMSGHEEELTNTAFFQYSVSNATPEALEVMAFKQGGIWNVISDEAGAINVLLGNVYSESKSNADIVLQGWDGDYMASSRITREGSDGHVRGTISVLAQDETIQTILEAGARGNGISERFLLLREKNLLGERVFESYQRPDQSIIDMYDNLIHKLIKTDLATFAFSNEAMDLIRKKKSEIEPHLADGQKYANNMLRGALGKMDKQVMKMSCVLHVAEHWTHGEGKVISGKTVEWAVSIYDELMKMYISAANSKGYIGEDAEIIDVIEQFRKFADKRKTNFTTSELRSYIKSRPVFKNRSKLSEHLKSEVLPACEKLGLCCVVNNRVYVSPKLS